MTSFGKPNKTNKSTKHMESISKSSIRTCYNKRKILWKMYNEKRRSRVYLFKFFWVKKRLYLFYNIS